MPLRSRHLLGIKELEKEEIQTILDTTDTFKEVLQRPIKKVPALMGKTVINFFLEPSTRTSTSFELAAKRLSADTVNFSVRSSSFSKGESLLDTAKTLESMKIDALVIRHKHAGAPYYLSKTANYSVINAGDGTHEHPTQALLDLYSIREKKKKIAGLNVVIVGDILHSRVARSNIYALTSMGASVTLVAPPTLLPAGLDRFGVNVTNYFDEVIEEADIIYLLRLQLERQNECFIPSLREYARLFGLNRKRLDRAKKDVLIMHPGPINRGVEIAPDVADMETSIINEQVENGVAVRMAILYLLLGGREED